LDEIWNTLEYIVGVWRRQILGAIRAVATAGERGEILFWDVSLQVSNRTANVSLLRVAGSSVHASVVRSRGDPGWSRPMYDGRKSCLSEDKELTCGVRHYTQPFLYLGFSDSRLMLFAHKL